MKEKIPKKNERDEGQRGSRPSSIVLSSIVFCLLAIMTTGCATNGNSPISMQTPSDPLEMDDPNAIDDDFAFLEDKLVEEKIEVPDPLEPVNRVMFGFNDVLYFWVAKPILGAYAGIMPEPARLGIRNFFNNASTPVRLVNCLLQGKFDDANTESRRFVVNTTVGILGFGDPALDQHGWEPVKEDLGQTLGIYGFDEGFYIVWPFFGPSTARDSVGMAGDQFLNPLRYVEDREASIALSVTKGVNAGSFQIGTYEEFKEEAFEPYIAMREFYVQYRRKQIEE